MSVKMQSGGLMNSYKVRYSQETHDLLKVLMEEAKLTTAQRSQMREALKKGEPLPVVTRRRPKPSYVDENLFDLKKNYYFLRRSKDQIVHSGAYERDKFRMVQSVVDLEQEKERLRNIMTYGKNKKLWRNKTTEGQAKKEKSPNVITAEERLEELIAEIEDRLEFLKEMQSLGQVKNYEAIIKQELAAKLREIKKLDKNVAQKYLQYLAPPPKLNCAFLNSIDVTS